MGVILIVEDNGETRKTMRASLEGAHHVVVEAEEGTSALLLASRHDPDLVLLDFKLPDMEGVEVARRLHVIKPSLPILAITGWVRKDEMLSGAFVDLLVKPFEAAELVAAVAKHLPAPNADATALESDYARRLTNQIERQASDRSGIERRTSLQKSATIVLDTLASSLAQQRNPESMLADTLDKCLDATGLSVGAILLEVDGELVLQAQVGSSRALEWKDHHSLLATATRREGLVVPSIDAGGPGDALLRALNTDSAIIVPIISRDEALGVMLLASRGAELAGTGGDSTMHAARSVSMQLGQALALSRMFAKLAAAEQRYRALFENARDAISIATPDGVILEANRRMSELFGVPHNALLGRHVDECKLVERSSGSTPPIPIGRPDGTSVQVEFSTTCVAVGCEQQVLSIGRDVSSRLRLEEQLRQSQKMDAIGQLAGGVAHDFNNVLSVIMSYAEIMLDQLSADAPMRADVEEIRLAGRRASELTRHLLVFSRQQVVEPKVIDLDVLLAGINKMLERIIGADIDFVFESKEALGHVRADPGSIEQVIMNLVVNARDAMPTGGRLTIETANVTLDSAYAKTHHTRAGKHVMLAVTDSGSGMDHATQLRIFEPFFTTKGVGKGTGLGLSTVFGIVEQSGGSLAVSSEVGKGSTFTVYLPRVDEETDSVGTVQSQSIAGGTETVLLVEDDAQVRAVARHILFDAGYCILEACDAAEAITLSQTHASTIHLLLTDVVLPQVSGPELAKQLLVSRPEMRVLCMSGYSNDENERRGVSSSDIDYLQKPLTPLALTRRVREVLDRTVN